jgi:NAD+ synthase
MLEMLIDKEASVADVVALGYDRETVKKIEHLIYINEYKRFQSAPGTRLTERAFWLDRRYPIVNRWRDSHTGRCRSCLSERASGCSGSRGCRT